MIFSLWSAGFLVLIIWLLITQALFLSYEYIRYKQLTKPPVALAVGQVSSIFGFMVGRAILCGDHNHFEPCFMPRNMWHDIRRIWTGSPPDDE